LFHLPLGLHLLEVLVLGLLNTYLLLPHGTGVSLWHLIDVADDLGVLIVDILLERGTNLTEVCIVERLFLYHVLWIVAVVLGLMLA
jgi:hypothetical protein